MDRFVFCIENAIKKFNVNLSDRRVLTEAATGNYVCTPVLAALAGAEVFAYAKESKYGTVDEINEQIFRVSSKLGITTNINIITDLELFDLSTIDVLTNTGFLRPISKTIINRLKSTCVIPLMWEPWEFREDELDIVACLERGIKVYGTNESDPRLQTMDYIGFIALYFLLKEKRTPNSTSTLIVGCEKFNRAINKVLKANGYNTTSVLTKEYSALNIEIFDSIIIAEYERPTIIVSDDDNALIKSSELNDNHLIIHIAGNVNLENVNCRFYPEKPAPFRYMSYTTDFIDPAAVVDLHCAGLKVAEGMVVANEKKLSSEMYKFFMESKYPALAFDDKRYW